MLYFRPQSCLLHLSGQNWVGIDIKTHLQQTRISLNTMKEQVNNLKSIPTPSPIIHSMKIYYVHKFTFYNLSYYQFNLAYIARMWYICHATGMEETPKVALDIHCLWRGGGAALTSMTNKFLHREVMAVHGL